MGKSKFDKNKGASQQRNAGQGAQGGHNKPEEEQGAGQQGGASKNQEDAAKRKHEAWRPKSGGGSNG